MYHCLLVMFCFGIEAQEMTMAREFFYILMDKMGNIGGNILY